jgi:hypothetical protein
MKKNSLSIVIAAGMFLALGTPGAFAAGSTACEFLLMGVGARAQGVGSAYTALSDDSNSIYWNQAGLGLVSRPEVSFMHNAWVEGIGYDSLTVGIPTVRGTFGISAHYLNSGEIVGRETQVSSVYRFGATSSMISLGYGRPLTGSLLAGCAVKYIGEQIEDVNAGTYAFDLGVLYRQHGSPLSLGLAVQNLGGRITFIEEAEDLPLTLSLGLGYRIGGITIGTDVRHYVYDQATDVCVGTEFAPLGALSLRGGLLYSAVRSAAGDMRNGSFSPAGGIGLKVGKSRFDYALTPLSGFGATHKVSMTLQF